VDLPDGGGALPAAEGASVCADNCQHSSMYSVVNILWVPRRQTHRRSGLATLSSVGAIA